MTTPNQYVMPFDARIIKARTYAFHRHDVYANQFYDKKLNLPYSYHVQLVVDTVQRFSYLFETQEDFIKAIIVAYFHDAVEDTRMTFNDLVQIIGLENARDVMRLTTDVRGETKADRCSDEYYANINTSFIASVVKLCDRIANVEHGILHNSSMVKVYMKDMEKLRLHFDQEKYGDLFMYLMHLEGVYNEQQKQIITKND